MSAKEILPYYYGKISLAFFPLGSCFDIHLVGIFPHSRTRGDVVGIVTRLRDGRSGVLSPVGQEFFFLSLKCPGSLWGKATGACS